MKAKALAKGQRIRVLIVDDSVVIRQLVTRALEQDSHFQVVGNAANGVIALQLLDSLKPDVITLDVEMPEMDGITTLREIRKRPAEPFVIMFSTLTERSAHVTLQALALGANDYVAKVSNVGSLSESMGRLRGELIPKLKQFFVIDGQQMKSVQPSSARTNGAAASVQFGTKIGNRKREAVVIGVSTGGPSALAEIAPMLPRGFHLPIFIVQHMPAIFTKSLAERLQSICALPVLEACDGSPVAPGHVYLAPGDFHMCVKQEGIRKIIRLNQNEQENSCRPAVDVLFRSVNESYRGNVVAVILTGMGQDGKRGVEALRSKGATVIAQDQNSSVVWGMPGAIVQAGLADSVVSLKSIVPEILRHLQN